jgi:PKD repeat protein
MIEDTSGLAVKSYFFNISSVIPSYSVLQPSNGAEFTAGQNIKLIIANNGPYGAANIYLYSDSGYNQYLSNVYLNEGSNSVSINLPSALLTDSFRFQVINSGGYSRSTYSGKFKVVALPPSLTFVKPDMAYIYFSNTPPTLEWTSNHLDSVRFEYSSDNKATWTPIPGKYASYDGVINNAYPAFPLPDVYSETSYIKAISDAPAVEQISKVFITSNKADTFMFYEPLSGAEYFAGNTVSLSFEYRGRWRNSVSIYFKPSPTADTSLLVTTLDPNYNLWGVRNIYWNIPPYLASTDSGVFYAELTGLGNYYSPLVKIHELSPSLNLGRPYADQYWQSGKKYPIQWYPVKVDMIKMELSTDGGSSWTLLKDSVSSISYTTNYDSIIAPAFTGLTTTAKFKITSLANSSIYYASNNFMLSNLPEAIRIIKPDSNAIIKAGTNFTCEYNYRGDRNTGLQFFIKKYNEEKEFYLDNEIYNPAIGLNTSNIRIPEYFPATDSAIFIIADKNHPNNNLSQSFLLSDTSDFFTVLAADPYININSPNISSYVLGGSTTSISFYALTTPKVQILYSTDAGLTWTSIVDTIECINGTNSYTWTVPLFVDEMPNCRVKIVSLSDNSVYALSQVFQITNIPAGVTIISPNGGEQYKAGNSYYIEYKYIGEDAYWGMVDISSNNGASWNTLTELYNEIKPGKNYFLLNIPAYLDSGNLYKIRLTINDKYSDVSDGVFSVLAGESQIKINYPTVSTGYLKSDNFYSISWNSALIDAVDIAYSIDGGSSWNDVITNLANYNGYNYYYWKIPQLDSIYENSVLRIMSTKDSGIVSYSNIMLSNVDGTINILQPDSSTVWEAGEYVWVNFEAKGLAGDMGGGFYLRYNQTDVYIGYIGKIVSGYNSVGFMLPYTLDSGLVRPVIRFYGNTANGKDSEQAYVGQQFFIKSAGPFIKVFSPTASNYFVKNESGMIRWNSFKVKSVNIDLTLDGGLTWKRVASDVISTYQENMHEFVAPDTSTNYARFRITPVDTTIGIVAESETFTIFNGQVTLTLSAPNGNQLIIGQNFNVEFNYTGGYKAAYISVSNDSMKTWNNIQTVTTQPGNNIMQVFIPYDAVPGSYWLRVIDQNNVGDTSLTFSNVIAPLPFINVTHPAYGNLLTSGTINKISWNSFNADTMDIYYSLDSGITYNHIISDFVSGGSTGYYNWTLPVVSGNKNAFVKLISASGTVGISNWFIISDKGAYLALNSPNGGETYTAESSIELSYNYFGSNNIYVSVFVSADSGITWNQINGSFYTTPGLNKIPLYLSANYASNKAFIRIQKSDNPGMYDISNATFTISSASANIAVKQPSQGVYWVSGSVKTIQWNSFDVPAVKLEYSIDSAASWNTIISNVMSLNGLNSYNWAIPSITGTFKNCQVRISGGIIADTSYLFTLSDRYPSTDARLTTLLVDSTAISGFNDTVYSYTYTVPYSTTVPPVIDGITFDTLARKVVVDASAIPGDAYVDVTAEDGTTTKRYTVSFVKGSPSEEALLKEIDLDGVKMKGFVSGIFNYNSTVAAYAYSAPVVSAVATTTNAIINIVQASTVNGTARVTVTSESGGTTNTYFVKFNQAAFDIIDNETFNTAENRNVGAVIGIFATKNWNSRALNYVISEGNDDGIFDINANGELLLVDSAQLDYENASLSNPYFLMVAVQPADDPTRTDFAAVTINISDANDVPRIVHGQILSVAENSTSGTFVNNVLINHQDVGQYVTYSILSGNTNDAFAIETVNDGGRLTVNNAAMLNYEETQQFALIIQASDNGSPIMSSTDTVRVTVTNVNESPVIADAVMYVKEYSANGTIIDTARASDVDLTDHITYSIQYQPITGVFTIDATSGAIKLLDSSKIDYATKSQYLLRIRATDLSGAFKEAKVTIFVIDVPYKTVYADFEYTVDNVNPLLLSFNSTSTGNPTAYFWTFGDGQSFVGSSTDHSYNSAGLYNVCLTVVDDKEGYTDKKCYNVQVGQPTCVIAADFGYGVNGDTIFITNASNGNIASYYWTFGDGTTSFDKDPVHIYNTEGYYLVTLAVSDTAKKCTDFNSQFVKIGAVSCLADFTYISNEKNVTFTNNSEGTISYYFWDFGDGTFDTGTSPEHVYRKNGKYMVSLTVANSDASCMDNLMMPVQVGSFSCNAAFTYILEQGTYSVLFTEDDLPESANVLWSFGDGHASADHNPTYKYKYPGYYTVSLNTFNAASNCMDFYQEVILVGEEGDDCEADFIYQISSTNPNNVKFIDKSKGAIEYYIWDYNDDYIEIANNPDHTFQKTGYFNVCLTVITPKDISNTTCKKVGVGVTENANIIANFTYVVKGDSVYFADISKGRVNKWEWNFGGGLSNGTDSVEKVKYSASGYYVVSMKASNTASGATDKIYKVVNIGKADTMLARFGFDAQNYNAKAGGYPVDFIGAGLGDQTKLKWDFGDTADYKDNIDTTNTNPTHNYPEGGQQYYVCYTIKDPITEDSSKYCEYITTKEQVNIKQTNNLTVSLSAYPNPFTTSAFITYQLKSKSKVQLSIYDINGRLINNIISATQEAGPYMLKLDGSVLEEGVYVIKLKTNNGTVEQMLMKQ